MKNKIPHCQQIQIEYKGNLHMLKEVIYAVRNGQTISFENFKTCMEFIYREGWGDCFMWNGELSGETTRKEFFEILNINRYRRE
jgi:hypothetical protein